jgi:small conductance mechanosensitive channel
MTLLQIPDVPAVLPDSVPDTRNELHMLATLPADELIAKLISSMVTFAINLAIAVAVFYIGRFIIRKLYGLVNRIFERRHIDQSLRTFVLSMVKIVLYFILVVIVIGILGIETSSFLALFASAGVAIGMALSGTLQNFAGGVLILLLKPYRIGDYIEAQGYAGTVREIQIFHTIICTPDNKSIIIPNGGLSTGSVNNYSRQEYRRVDWTVSISYGDKVDAARARILEILQADPDVVRSDSADNSMPVADCSPSVVVNELAASSVDLKVSAWTKTSSYWSLYYRINETIYNQLGSAGISFPFPQLDVHVQTNDKTRS